MNNDLQCHKSRLFRKLSEKISNKSVIHTMAKIQREKFIPYKKIHSAYEDISLPIGQDQTISQPTIVAMMTQALAPKKTDVVLEIGTGSGYQTAILSLLSKKVVSTERIPELANKARLTLKDFQYNNISIHLAGPELGRPKDAPFNGIVVTAGAPCIPERLLDQLAPGGRLVIPVGPPKEQQLLLITKKRNTYTTENLGQCRFVPLIGKGAWPDKKTGQCGTGQYRIKSVLSNSTPH